LKVIDYDVAAPQFHERYGHFWFKLLCEKCKGVCEDINDLESAKELKAKVEAKRKQQQEVAATNEAVSV
jgi:hypothetical protein